MQYEPEGDILEMSDAALVLTTRAGDRRAFGHLFARHQPLLLRLCQRALGNRWWGEDAAQEAALRALVNLDRLRDASQFGSWLAGIGLNICREWLRTQTGDWESWEALQGGRSGPELQDEGLDPSEIADERLLAERVRHAVSGLADGQRSAVLLFYLRGLTHAETAAALGIEVGAVKARLFKARGRLRQTLWDEREEVDVTQAVTQTSEAPYIAMRVSDVRRRRTEQGDLVYIVVLEEMAGARRIPIWIGPYEGQSLARAHQKVDSVRPMTYNFTANLLQASGARLREVRIAQLTNNTFFAEAIVESAGQTATVDARASDALNLALLLDTPIAVHVDVIAQCILEQESESPTERTSTIFGPDTEGAAEIVASLGDLTIPPIVEAKPTETLPVAV